MGICIRCEKQQYCHCKRSSVMDCVSYQGPHWRKPSVKIDDVECMKLYRERKTDREIAELLGCATSAVFRWRKKNNIPKNHIPGINLPPAKKYVSYKKALPPEQWENAERFLNIMARLKDVVKDRELKGDEL
ncbi:MAG: hypothetical protein H6Q73_3796 [Firmicutes bacterium]|nr:hypothetical protein [Bacillota bacterium]